MNVIQVQAYNNVFSFDDEETLSQPAVKEDVELSFDYDPLAFAISALDCNRYLFTDIHSFLTNEDPSIFGNASIKDLAVTDSAVQHSKKIKKYYKNRLLMRRLKGLYISDYMKSLEELVESTNTIKKSQVKILVKLPEFYKENTETDAIFENCQSIKTAHATITEFDDVFKFVGSVERNAKNDKATRYYFANDKNNFLLYNARNTDKSKHLMDYIIQQDRPIRINGFSSLKPQPGYEDFYIYQEGNFKFFNV